MLELRIASYLEDMDVRRELGVPPKRLNINRSFVPKHEFVYVQSSRTMFDFSGMSDPDEPYWIIRRGIKFSQYRSDGNLHVFNMEWDEYDMTMFTRNHQFGPSMCKNHIVLRKPVKFRENDHCLTNW